MINLITGVPGSGKTCLALKLMTDKYFNYDKSNKVFYLKPEFSDYVIFTNIEDLKLPHINLNQAMKDAGKSFEDFFTVPYQQIIAKKYPKIIYIIDECQRFISKRLKNTETIFYFDYHRHLGHDVFLITQDSKKISYEIASLCEYEYRLVKRSLSLLGEFRYMIKSADVVIESKTFKAPKRIFKLYRSFFLAPVSKFKSPLRKVLFLPLLGFLIAGYFFFKMLYPDADAEALTVDNYKTNQKQSAVEKVMGGSSSNQKVASDPVVPSHWVEVKLSSITVGDSRYYVHPVTGAFLPRHAYKSHEIRTTKTIFGEITTARFDPDTLPKPEKQGKSEASASKSELNDPH